MKQGFTIQYRLYWCGPCERYGDTRTETVIHADGRILARRYDHRGKNGHYRVIERASGSCSVENAAHLYWELSELIRHREQISPSCDIWEEVILETPGVVIKADAGVSDGRHSCSEVLDTFLKSLSLCWEPVTHTMRHTNEETARYGKID